jgi:hypothetical protein
MAHLLRFMFVALSAMSAGVTAALAQQPTEAKSSIGYPTVAAAL